jgi:FlaA1/EpsC-like NDP-sugar epimerase
MIRLSGLVEEQDIKIEYSGLRPGEKLYEELLTDKEDLLPSHNPLIFKAKKEILPATLASGIDVLIEMAAQGATAEALVKQMKILVPEFKSMHSPFEKLD